jgi:hypothetical protein
MYLALASRKKVCAWYIPSSENLCALSRQAACFNADFCRIATTKTVERAERSCHKREQRTRCKRPSFQTPTRPIHIHARALWRGPWTRIERHAKVMRVRPIGRIGHSRPLQSSQVHHTHRRQFLQSGVGVLVVDEEGVADTLGPEACSWREGHGTRGSLRCTTTGFYCLTVGGSFRLPPPRTGGGHGRLEEKENIRALGKRHGHTLSCNYTCTHTHREE